MNLLAHKLGLGLFKDWKNCDAAGRERMEAVLHGMVEVGDENAEAAGVTLNLVAAFKEWRWAA